MSESSTCRLLADETERTEARRIIKQAYIARGYASGYVNNEAVAQHFDSDSATTLGLFRTGRLYGTIALILDSPRGLPMDSLYEEELAPWRTEGKRLAEAGQFAVDPAQDTGAPFEVMPLFAALLRHAIDRQVDQLCISINPRHDRFYAALGFEQIGEQKHYGAVGAPAIARAFCVPEWEQNTFLKNLVNTVKK